jgi:uncharacterized membrane protein YoaK (UPF0700 family)
MPAFRANLLLSLILAFLSGYIDTAVFVHTGGLFVAHVTGNFILLGATVAGVESVGHGSSTVLQLISFPLFFVSAALAGGVSGRLSKDNQTLLLLFLSALLITGIGAACLSLSLPDTIASMGLVVAMAWLNAAHRLDSRLGAPFTVMTGNVTSIALELAYTLKIGKREETPNITTPNASPKFRMLYLVLSFAVGCALGALSLRAYGLETMLLPGFVLVLGLLSITLRRP